METERIDPGGDDATRAFNEVRDRLAGLTRAVDSMAGEWKALTIPDYTDTLAEIRGAAQALASHYRKLRDAPALSVTPDQLAAQINAASVEARKAERQSLQGAGDSFAAIARELTAYVESARTADRQNKWNLGMFALGVMFGAMAFWLIGKL